MITSGSNKIGKGIALKLDRIYSIDWTIFAILNIGLSHDLSRIK